MSIKLVNIRIPDKIDIIDGENLEFGTGNDLKIGVVATDQATIANVTQDKDIIFTVNDGGVTKEPMRLDGSEGEVLITKVKFQTNSIDAGTNKIINVVDPTADQEAATKKFVDDQIATTVFVADQVWVHTGNGHGSTNTKIRRFTTVLLDIGSDITYTASAIDGDKFTINTAGLYHIEYKDVHNGAETAIGGISINSTALTTSIVSVALSLTDGAISRGAQGANNVPSFVSIFCGPLAANDIIRAHTDALFNISDDRVYFRITRINTA